MIQVRFVTTHDTAAWVEMRADLWPEYGTNWHAKEVAAFLAGSLRMPLAVLVAVDETDQPVGFAELSIRTYAEDCETDHVAYLEGWYVRPDYRRQGVGRALIQSAETWARSQGCTEFGSDAVLDNAVSASAHLALGFVETVQLRCFKKPI